MQMRNMRARLISFQRILTTSSGVMGVFVRDLEMLGMNEQTSCDCLLIKVKVGRYT